VTQASSGAEGTIGASNTGTTQKFIISNGIDFDNTGVITINGVADTGNPTCSAAQHAPFTTGTYEIIRTATAALVTNFLFYAPGQPNCATYTACIDPLSISNDLAKLYATTPMMPMWPDISNSIALHDTTMRVVFDAGFETAEAYLVADTGMSDNTWNIGYGSLGYSGTMIFDGHTRCEDVQAELIKFKDGGVTGFSTTNTPYPSLLDPNDSTRSICDCRKMDAMSTTLTSNIMWDITCPAFIGNHLWVTGARGGGIRAIAKESVTEKAYLTYTYIRQIPPSGIETKVAVGDKITVISSNSNNNKQYTVTAFVDDGTWGSGKKNIWSTAAGYLGKDHANGVTDASSTVLSNTMDYKAYGDFVQFAKVEPAPTTDYQITEMKAVGQNSTLFTRTLESISTTDTSIATLTFYDGIDSGDANIAALTGTFQLTYDGEDTAVMQALVSASDMMEALSGLSTVDIAPVVTRSAATSGLPSITWTITFDSKMGDAKKLTFKYTDTIGTERQESAIVDSGGSATLKNLVTVKAEGTDYSSQVKRDIVMQYTQEGSTFFDSLSATASTVHDELAADVTVGTTLSVKASEEIYYYIFDEGAASTGNAGGKTNAEDMCEGTKPYITYEFNGQVSLPTVVCASTSAITTDANMDTQLNKLTGLETASCAWTGVNINGRAGTPDTTFNQHFPWGASHKGTARVLLKCTLPLGVDGSSFKIHAHLDSTHGWRLGAINNAGQAYQYRARNNNGRSFTVTQAYENKISDMTHFSRVPAASGDSTVYGSTYGIVAISAITPHADIGTAVTAGTIKYNPGTYYNVKLHKTTGSQKHAFAKVVVGIDGVKEVEIVYGGYLADVATAAERTYHIKCDTRINTGLTCAADGTTQATNMEIEVVAGGLATHATFNVLSASLVVGASSAQVSGVVTSMCSTNGATRRHVNAECFTTSATGTLHTTNTLLECTCASVSTDLASCKVVGGGSGTSTPPADITALNSANVFCHPDGNEGGVGNDAAAEFAPASINSFYHVAGFYDSGTPKFFVDALHEGALDATALLNSQSLTIMGARSGTSNYPYRSFVGVNERQLYNDLQSIGPQQAGSGRQLAAISPTASVVAGTQGDSVAAGYGVANFYVDHAEKYQYAGRGFDQLTVTPQPDRMTDQKIVVTYRGAAGSCSVKEVDRGTHESAVCSGRGNCDHATGTCVCDAGYTLEACSEQTVLV